MLNEENEVVKETTKDYIEKIVNYCDIIDAYDDRGDISEAKSEVTKAMLGLQEISKTKDFQANPKSYIGLKNIDKFRQVLDAQSDKNSPYYVSSASGFVNFYDHDKFIDRAVQVSEAVLKSTRGTVAPGMLEINSDLEGRGGDFKSQILTSRTSTGKGI
jgi:hypothetical protein